MTLTKTLVAIAATILLAGTAIAGDMKIMVKDAYARSTNPKVAAAFMGLMNHADEDDRLVAASSDAAKRVELHTHLEVDGIMKMTEVEEGFPIPAGGMAQLERGGQHVMLMGLSEPLKQGDMLSVTLTFENAGEITLEIPVDNKRKAPASAHGGHKSHGS